MYKLFALSSFINDTKYYQFLKTDPVRPSIPIEQRFGPNKECFFLLDEDNPVAAVCVAYLNFVPKTEQELLQPCESEGQNAIFYTIWSTKPGAGRTLLNQALNAILATKISVRNFFTLSPTTEMAKKFHMANGAHVFCVNEDTVNYQYKIAVDL